MEFFVTHLIPNLTLDEIEELLDIITNELETPHRENERNARAERFRQNSEIYLQKQNEFNRHIIQSHTNYLQEHILNFLSNQPVTYQEIMNMALHLGYSDVDVEEQVKFLIWEGKIFVSEDGMLTKV